MVYVITYTFFNWQGKWQRKEKKKKNIGHAWIRTTVFQSVGLQESILDHSATTYDIHTRAIYL